MKCKVFNIMLQRLGATTGEKKLNDFLINNNIVNYYATLVNGSSTFWSILIFYEDKHDAVKQQVDNVTKPLLTHGREMVANLKITKTQ